MKKVLKISSIVIGSIVLLLLIVGFGGWLYVKATFLYFEKDYAENKNLKELTINGFTFLDRNGNGKLDIYEDSRKTIEERTADLLSQMTIEERIHLLKGSGLASAMGMKEKNEGIDGAVGTIVPTPRLGIPTIYLSDGPAGLRIMPKRKGETKTYYCTAFPIETMLASSWNTKLVEKVGFAMGNEALEYGIDIILGPAVNIHRNPLCGRNFEYYSEDPLLSGMMGASMVNGIQANGVGTSVKHYVANNQETGRNVNDVIVSERALREIYLKSFELIVKNAHPWTIMSSYNRVNGNYTSESKHLLTEILRNSWGFKGLVMSDWFGGYDAAAQIKAGNDLLEPGTKRQWKALKKAYRKGILTEKEIDIAAKRILRIVLQSRKMQNYAFSNNPNLKAHAKITRQSATEGIVLLKNNNALPLTDKKNIALLGITSYGFIAGGTGSGDVNEAYTISLEEGLKNAGYKINEQAQKIDESHKKANAEAFIKPQGFKSMLHSYHPPEIKYTNEQLKNIAEKAEIGIITIGRNSGEGKDRATTDDFLLSKTEQEMISNASQVFHKLGKKLIVVLNIGGVIETASWKVKPDAIVLAWQGGQEGGNSVADILSGNVNPSGKLPMSFPINLKDHASSANFPIDVKSSGIFDVFGNGKAKSDKKQIKNKDYTNYEEGIYVGYRHFDKARLKVSYPFGYGLSYTQFEFSDMKIKQNKDTIFVSVRVKNKGKIKGKEVVQLYTHKTKSKIDRPVQELKAFAKTTELEPEESEQIQLGIPILELRYWNEEKAQWELEKGNYEIRVAASSRDIRLSKSINLE